MRNNSILILCYLLITTASCAQIEEFSAVALDFTNDLVESIPLIKSGPRQTPYRSRRNLDNKNTLVLGYQMDTYRAKRELSKRNSPATSRTKKKTLKCKPPAWSRKFVKYASVPNANVNIQSSLDPKGLGAIDRYDYGPFEIVAITGDIDGITVRGHFTVSFRHQIAFVLRNRGIEINTDFDLFTALIHYIVDTSCYQYSDDHNYRLSPTVRKVRQMAAITWGLIKAQNAGEITLINSIIDDFVDHIMKK